MGKIFHRFILILEIFITVIFTISLILKGDPKSWDAEICIYLFNYCTVFYIFMIIWVIGFVLFFLGFIFIKAEY